MNQSTAQVTEITTQAQIDYTVMDVVDAHSVFPEIFEIPGEAKIKRRKHRHPDCIEANPDYVPDPEVAKLALIWMLAPRQEMALGLQGHTGTGKTELVLYLADKLNLPVYITKIHGRTTPMDLEGSYALQSVGNGSTVTVKEYGPAAKAYKNGGILLIDEFDKANGDLTSAMHLLVEGKPWPLEMFKETIIKHSQCYVVGTANTFGNDGHDYRYSTSNKLDQAFLSRFAWLKTEYPDVHRESVILEKGFPKLPAALRMQAIKLANAFRNAALGVNRDGDAEDAIQCIFSTRVLVSWCYYMMAFGLSRTPMQALEFVFLSSVAAEDKETATTLVETIFGDSINKTLREWLSKK